MWASSSKLVFTTARLTEVGRRRLLGTVPTRKYTPCGSYWIQHDNSSVAEMGITTRFFDQEIPDGEIEKMTLHPWCVGGGVSLHWSGLKITDGDELYHTVWTNTEGAKEVDLQDLLPSITIHSSIELNKEKPTYDTCERAWLLRITNINNIEKSAFTTTAISSAPPSKI